jgi:hypothetical protein
MYVASDEDLKELSQYDDMVPSPDTLIPKQSKISQRLEDILALEIAFGLPMIFTGGPYAFIVGMLMLGTVMTIMWLPAQLRYQESEKPGTPYVEFCSYGVLSWEDRGRITYVRLVHAPETEIPDAELQDALMPEDQLLKLAETIEDAEEFQFVTMPWLMNLLRHTAEGMVLEKGPSRTDKIRAGAGQLRDLWNGRKRTIVASLIVGGLLYLFSPMIRSYLDLLLTWIGW